MKKTIGSMSADEITEWHVKKALALKDPQRRETQSKYKSDWWKKADAKARSQAIERSATTKKSIGNARFESCKKRALPYEPVEAKRIRGALYIRHDGKVGRAQKDGKLTIVYPRLQK